jgi:hypothetical protein
MSISRFFANPAFLPNLLSVTSFPLSTVMVMLDFV